MEDFPFGSNRVITQQISEGELSTYFVGFDIDDDGLSQFRWKNLVNKILQALQEFAFGTHEGTSTLNSETVLKINEAAKHIYSIDAFQKAKDFYLVNHYDDEFELEDKYQKRGEFGELILHLLLRDFHKTIPLLSKIHFKDTFGATVHGFDAVHIQPETKTLWLGESKLYTDGKSGVAALIEDLKEHFKTDYLNSEFILVSKKMKLFDNIPEKDHWLNLMNESTTLKEQLESINIPLLCTYTSNIFSKYTDEKLSDFINDYEIEVRKLKAYFDDHNDHPLKTKMNIILLLFPVKSKNELVKRLHIKLSNLQQILD